MEFSPRDLIEKQVNREGGIGREKERGRERIGKRECAHERE